HPCGADCSSSGSPRPRAKARMALPPPERPMTFRTRFGLILCNGRTEENSMSKVMLLVGTRKGCFVLESDGDRHDWDVRGPFCEGWPDYHAVYAYADGAIYGAAASEWHGATVWRSPDLGETWAQSSEGLG